MSVALAARKAIGDPWEAGFDSGGSKVSSIMGGSTGGGAAQINIASQFGGRPGNTKLLNDLSEICG